MKMQNLIHFSLFLPLVISGIFVCEKTNQYKTPDVDNFGYCEIIRMPCSFHEKITEVLEI